MKMSWAQILENVTLFERDPRDSRVNWVESLYPLGAATEVELFHLACLVEKEHGRVWTKKQVFALLAEKLPTPAVGHARSWWEHLQYRQTDPWLNLVHVLAKDYQDHETFDPAQASERTARRAHIMDFMLEASPVEMSHFLTEIVIHAEPFNLTRVATVLMTVNNRLQALTNRRTANRERDADATS